MNTKLISSFQKIANSPLFINITTAIIVLYAVILGIRTYDSVVIPFEIFFMALDYIVTLYFLIELIIRMVSEDSLKKFFKDKWNIFDFVIVVITLIPIQDSDFAMIARLIRVFRVLRLISLRPELKVIIDVLIKSIPAITDIIVLMFIIFYIYAIVGSFLFQDLKSGLWDNFAISMLTLFRVFTFEDWTDVMYEAMEKYDLAWLYFVSFIIIAAFVFFNLFVAVIISEMEKLNQENKKDDEANKDKMLHTILEKLENIEKKLK